MVDNILSYLLFILFKLSKILKPWSPKIWIIILSVSMISTTKLYSLYYICLHIIGSKWYNNNMTLVMSHYHDDQQR